MASAVPSALPTRSVVRIFGAGAERQYLTPWKVATEQDWTGSGFLILARGEKVVLTNAHVVDNASVLRLSKHGESKKHQARLLCVAHDIDLALIAVEDPVVFEDVPAVEFACPLPKLYSEVNAVGFPQGGSTICVTKGVVSRIDAQVYCHPQQKGMRASLACNPGDVLLVQIDAAINPGNSGGPAFDPSSGKVVGVASSGMSRAQNVGYIIPSAIARNFLDEFVETAAWSGLPEVGFTYDLLENECLRRYLGLGEAQTGVQVTSVALKGGPAGKLQPGDVLLEIGGYKVSSEGTIKYDVADESVNLSFECLVTSARKGVSMELRVLRAGEERQIDVVFSPLDPLAKRFDRVDCDPIYFMVGGYVFSPMSLPLLSDPYAGIGGAFLTGHSVQRALHCWKEADEEVVLLLGVLKHRINEGYNHSETAVVRSLQGRVVTNMTNLVKGIAHAVAAGDEYLVFEFVGTVPRQTQANQPVTYKEVLLIADLAKADEELLKQHQIPARCSQHLLELYTNELARESAEVSDPTEAARIDAQRLCKSAVAATDLQTQVLAVEPLPRKDPSIENITKVHGSTQDGGAIEESAAVDASASASAGARQRESKLDEKRDVGTQTRAVAAVTLHGQCRSESSTRVPAASSSRVGDSTGRECSSSAAASSFASRPLSSHERTPQHRCRLPVLEPTLSHRRGAVQLIQHRRPSRGPTCRQPAQLPALPSRR